MTTSDWLTCQSLTSLQTTLPMLDPALFYAAYSFYSDSDSDLPIQHSFWKSCMSMALFVELKDEHVGAGGPTDR